MVYNAIKCYFNTLQGYNLVLEKITFCDRND